MDKKSKILPEKTQRKTREEDPYGLNLSQQFGLVYLQHKAGDHQLYAVNRPIQIAKKDLKEGVEAISHWYKEKFLKAAHEKSDNINWTKGILQGQNYLLKCRRRTNIHCTRSKNIGS